MTHGPTIPMQPATLRDIAAAVNVKHAGGTSIEGTRARAYVWNSCIVD